MPFRFGFVMEQTLGQVTHTQNFQHFVAQDPDVAPTWIPTQIRAGRWSRPHAGDPAQLDAPGEPSRPCQRRNAVLRTDSLDALFFHTRHGAVRAWPHAKDSDRRVDGRDAAQLLTPSASLRPCPERVEDRAIKNALTRRRSPCTMPGGVARMGQGIARRRLRRAAGEGVGDPLPGST